MSPHCPLSSCAISRWWRRPDGFLPGKEGAVDLGGADTPHQSQWLITGVRAQPHVHRFPGDPRDKANIRDSAKPLGGIWQQRSTSLSPFALPPSLEAGFSEQCSWGTPGSLWWSTNGVGFPLPLERECKPEASRRVGLGPWLDWVKATASRKPSLVASIHTLSSPLSHSSYMGVTRL